MKETGEWGRYFPPWLSPFPYNSSVAYEYYPLAKEEALELRLLWREPEGEADRGAAGAGAVGVEYCSVTGRPFRILPQEHEFYGRLGVPLPLKCPDVRRQERMRAVKQAIRYYL
jgi:hypothetical protein